MQPRVGLRNTRFLVEGKFAPFQASSRSNGLALVAGLVRHPRSEAVPGGFTDWFAYLAMSTMPAGEAVLLHLNVGWHYDQEEDGIGTAPRREPHHNVFASAKLNLALSDRLMAVGEVYADHPILPGYQFGLRAWLVPQRVQLDLSYGGHRRSAWGNGVTAGLLATLPRLR